MKRAAKTLLIASLCLFAVAPAFAGHGHGHGRVFDRLDRQHSRIENGIDSGQLTRREARILKKQHRRISRLAHEFYEDDHLSKRERRTLRRKLNYASECIHDFRHNDEYRRYGHRPHRHWIEDYDNWPRYGYNR